MLDEAHRMEPGEWLSDREKEYVSHMLEWNIDNESKSNLQNGEEHNWRDYNDFISPENQYEEDGLSSSDNSDWNQA